MQQPVIGVEHLVTGMAASDAVEAAQIDELLNIFPADVPAAAQNHRIDGNFRPQLQAFHTVKGGDHITAYRQRAVIFQQHHIMLLQIRICIT